MPQISCINVTSYAHLLMIVDTVYFKRKSVYVRSNIPKITHAECMAPRIDRSSIQNLIFL